MVRVATRSHLTAADYLAWERAQESKHEFFDGEAYAMSGGSVRHNVLGGAVVEALRISHRDLGCVVMTSDQRVGVEEGKRYVYPDVTVVCGPVALERETRDVLANPTIIVEILSQSTEQYDRGAKWESYQQRPSLTDYILVSQGEMRIEHFRRGTEGWLYREFRGGRVALSNGAVLDVDAIYVGVFELPGD